MRSANCGITPEGWPFIGLCALVSLVMALLGWACLAIIFLVLFLFSLNFFRDPERVVPEGADVAVSPADGKVVCIDRRPDPFTGEMCQHVAIFMNIFNVHVNRVPVDCTIEGIRYFPGKFFNASLDKASTDNERCAYHLRDKAGNVWSMVQIAGLIARRIVCRVEQGDELAKGQRMGMIRFGSRVDLYLPQGYVVTAGMGENVFAGESAIARQQAGSHTNER